MKKTFFIFLFFLISCGPGPRQSGCFTGAFLADKPMAEDIEKFKADYGKKPYFILTFIDWNNFIDKRAVEDIYSKKCVMFVSWEPWKAVEKAPISPNEILSGAYDAYIKRFARRMKAVKEEVYLRFAHEMNGNWYPWSGTKIGKDKFTALYRYVKDIFDKEGADNVKWVFSINWEDVPRENNNFMDYYPGDSYVDFVGIDGYNWGVTQSWSKWMSFEEIFRERYNEVTEKLQKQVIISEFGSASEGGDKAKWIERAMRDIKTMKNIRAFILFNVNKEADWNFSAESTEGRELRRQLRIGYFKENR